MNKTILVSLSVIGVVVAIVIGGTIAYFSDVVTISGNTFSTGGAPDILNISDDGTTWAKSIDGITQEDIIPGNDEIFTPVYLKNIATDVSAEIRPYVSVNCNEACEEICGGYGSECSECTNKCYNLFDRGLEMKIMAGEVDLTDGYHRLSEYQSDRWCTEFWTEEQGGGCKQYGELPIIETLAAGDDVALTVYFQLPETDEDQTDLAGGKIKFDIEFRGKEVIVE